MLRRKSGYHPHMPSAPGEGGGVGQVAEHVGFIVANLILANALACSVITMSYTAFSLAKAGNLLYIPLALAILTLLWVAFEWLRVL